MSNSRGDRSVKADNVIGSQVIAGDQNRAEMRGVKVELPPADQVDLSKELADLRALMQSLKAPDAGKIDRALADAEKEATKPEPDRDEIGSALERALGYAQKASDFGDQAENIAPKVKALASWLGSNWHKILAVVGLGF